MHFARLPSLYIVREFALLLANISFKIERLEIFIDRYESMEGGVEVSF